MRPETGKAGAARPRSIVDSSRNRNDRAGRRDQDRLGQSPAGQGERRECATGADRFRELQNRARMRGAIARRMRVQVARITVRAIDMDARLYPGGKGLRHLRADRDGENPRGHGEQRHNPAPTTAQPKSLSTAGHRVIYPHRSAGVNALPSGPIIRARRLLEPKPQNGYHPELDLSCRLDRGVIRRAKEQQLSTQPGRSALPWGRAAAGQDGAVVTGAVRIGFEPRANVARVRS